jgi:hypothetical protein
MMRIGLLCVLEATPVQGKPIARNMQSNGKPIARQLQTKDGACRTARRFRIQPATLLQIPLFHSIYGGL